MMKRAIRISIVLAAAAAISLVLAAAAYATPNIAGRWEGSNGKVYVITQMGSAFTWRMPETGQTGFGNIDGYTAAAVWPFGSAEGTITVDAVDHGTRIEWNNGVVFTRSGGSGAEDEGTSGSPAGDWRLIGSQAREIYAGGNKLYAVRTGTSDLYEYSGSGTAWMLIGTGGSTYAVDSDGHVFGITPAGVWRYNNMPMDWTQIGGPAANLYAGGSNLFATNPDTGDIYRYNGTPHDWTKVGSSGITFAVDDNGQLFGLSPSGVFRYNGTPENWTQIGGPGTDLFAGGNKLFGTHPSTGDLYQYNGVPNSWTKIGSSGITFTVDGSGLIYGLSPSGVFRYNGTPENWTQIGDPGTDIEAGRTYLYGITADGNVWRYTP